MKRDEKINALAVKVEGCLNDRLHLQVSEGARSAIVAVVRMIEGARKCGREGEILRALTNALGWLPMPERMYYERAVADLMQGAKEKTQKMKKIKKVCELKKILYLCSVKRDKQS